MEANLSQILLIHCAFTWFMVGLIWTIQLVHYPLMGEVGNERFTHYAALHSQRISWIVVPVMLLELISGAYLWWAGVHNFAFGMSLLLLLLVWGSTALLQVPLHSSFTKGFNETSHRRLLRTNWLRTIAWSLRGGLVLMVLNAS